VLREFIALTELSSRTLRYYVQCGLLPAPPFRGTSTRYQRLHLLRALAVRRFKAESDLTLVAIRKRLDQMEEPELVAYVSALPLSNTIATALELPPPVTISVNEPANDSAKAVSAAPAVTETIESSVRVLSEWLGDSWHRLQLLPGLELHVAAGASPLVQRIVREIYEQYVGGPIDS